MCVFHFGSDVSIWRFSYKIFCCVDLCWHLGVWRVTELESWFPFVILVMFLFTCYVSGHAWPLHALLHSMFCIISTLFCWVNSFHQISTCLNCWCLSYTTLVFVMFCWHAIILDLIDSLSLFLLFTLSSTHTLLWGLMTCHFMIFKMMIWIDDKVFC